MPRMPDIDTSNHPEPKFKTQGWNGRIAMTAESNPDDYDDRENCRAPFGNEDY